jgi:hypothetical protein
MASGTLNETVGGVGVAAHTPGPWTLWISGDACPHRIGALGWSICDVQHYGYVNKSAAPIQTANARLIAAAPTMLSALQRIAEATPESTNSATLRDFQNWVRAVAETAIADAISKATGAV